MVDLLIRVEETLETVVLYLAVALLIAAIVAAISVTVEMVRKRRKIMETMQQAAKK